MPDWAIGYLMGIVPCGFVVAMALDINRVKRQVPLTIGSALMWPPLAAALALYVVCYLLYSLWLTFAHVPALLRFLRRTLKENAEKLFGLAEELDK